MLRKKRAIPTKPRFAYAIKRAYEVLVHIGANELPIDPVRICEFYPEIHIVSYTELKEQTGENDPLMFSERNARNDFLEGFVHMGKNSRIDGETRRMRDANDYLVVYDDRIDSGCRIRWTIAHELGHIFLGHFKQFDIATVVRGETGIRVKSNLTDEEYGVIEVEAHYFAAGLLTPATVLKKISVCGSAAGIQGTCGISQDAAIRRLSELKSLPYGSYEIEETLNRNFFNYIRKINDPDTEPFAPQLDWLPNKYGDYADYEHWHYVVACIGGKEKNAELCAAITNSVAIYDEGDLLIITENETDRSVADKHSDMILRCLNKYGTTGIETVSSISAEALVLLS